MKKYILLPLLFLIVSCNSNSKDLENEIATLKSKNDSLKTIIDTLNTKFIFDEASLTAVPMLWEKNENGEISAFIGYVAYNKYDKILFSNYSTFENSDTLTSKNFRIKINPSKTDSIYYKLLSESKYGKKIKYTVTDPTKNYR